MNFPDLLLPTNRLWAANALSALTLIHSLRKADWRMLSASLLHVFLGACVTLGLLWSIKAGIKPGLNFHVLGATLLTLMFGPYLALIAMALVLLLVTLFGASGLESYGINFLLMALLPVIVSQFENHVCSLRAQSFVVGKNGESAELDFGMHERRNTHHYRQRRLV